VALAAEVRLLLPFSKRLIARNDKKAYLRG
jgi:hypothetical protein